MVAGQAGLAGLTKLALKCVPNTVISGRKLVAIFLDRGFGDVNGLTQIETERPDVEAPEKYPCPAACASPWRLPSRTAMTHVRWLHGQSGHESTDYTRECGPLWRSMDGLIDVRSNEDEGRSERKTPTLCVETNRQKSEAKTKTEQHTTRHAAWTGQDRTGYVYGDILSAHIISHQFFAGGHTADQFACWCLVRRRLSWRAHVVQAEAAHCPIWREARWQKWKVPTSCTRMVGSIYVVRNQMRRRCARKRRSGCSKGGCSQDTKAYGALEELLEPHDQPIDPQEHQEPVDLKTTQTGWCSISSEKKMEMRRQQRRPQSSLSRHRKSPRKSFNRLGAEGGAASGCLGGGASSRRCQQNKRAAKPAEEPVEQPSLPPVERKALSKFAALRIVFGQCGQTEKTNYTHTHRTYMCKEISSAAVMKLVGL